MPEYPNTRQVAKHYSDLLRLLKARGDLGVQSEVRLTPG